MSTSVTKNAIKSHFAKRGIKFAVDEIALFRQLERLLGKDRYEQLEDIYERRSEGFANSYDLYKLFDTVQEANLFSSSQAEVALEVAVWISSMLESSLEADMKLIDLGCSVGNLASWVAEAWPKATVVGVDACEGFIRAANRENKASNLSFQVWDYSLTAYSESPVADVLVCSLGIDFPHLSFGQNLESKSCRETREYSVFFEESKKYFSNWRSAVTDGGRLFAVLRIASFSEFTALADACSFCGWSLDLASSTKIRVEDEQFPALAFTALPSEQFSEHELTSFWCQRNISELFKGYLAEPLAGVVYRLLSEKRELTRAEVTYPDGNIARTVIGKAGPFGYRFMNTTLGFEALQIVPVVEIEKLKPTFDWYLLPELQPEAKTVKNIKKRKR